MLASNEPSKQDATRAPREDEYTVDKLGKMLVEHSLELGKVLGGGLLATAFAVLIALATAKPPTAEVFAALYSVSFAIPSAAVLYMLSRFTAASYIVLSLLVLSYLSVALALFFLIMAIDLGAAILFAFCAFVAGLLFLLTLRASASATPQPSDTVSV